MPDMTTFGAAAGSGGVVAGIIIAVKEIIIKRMGRNGKGYATHSEIKTAIAESELREKEKMDKKADLTDVKIATLEHQKSCLTELRADTKEFQAQILMAVNNLQNSNQESFRRVHNRIDEVIKEIKK